MKSSTLHGATGTLALLIVASFWLSTLTAELFLGEEAVILVKRAIALYGLIPLALTMAITRLSGIRLGKRQPSDLVYEKSRRMAKIGRNGLLVMVPCALFLYGKAAAREFDLFFYGVQGIELLIGGVQLALLGKNFQAGLRLMGSRAHGVVLAPGAGE